MRDATSPQSGPAFHPGDRVRVTAPGVFVGLAGEAVVPDPAFPAVVMVRLRAGGRDIEIGFHPRHLEPAPPDSAAAGPPSPGSACQDRSPEAPGPDWILGPGPGERSRSW